MGVMTPTTNMETATRNLQNFKNGRAERPAKQCDNLPHLLLICAELPCLEATHFKKCIDMQDILYNVVERIM